MKTTERTAIWLASGLLAISAGIVSQAAAGEHEIGNLGLHKQQIKEYYGDHGDFRASDDSEYARDVAREVAKARPILRKALAAHDPADGKPVLLLDVDDTTLNTYTYEASNDFAYDREEAEQYVKDNIMDPVFGTPALAQWAEGRGIEIFYLSGRPENQRVYTARDLVEGEFPDVRPDRLILRNRENPPPYLEYCEPECTTAQFRTGTRKYLESNGYDILLDIADQENEVAGGHADHHLKLPNPMYYLQ
ncbi:HAD family hydrolase [Flindersiella endophytica]